MIPEYEECEDCQRMVKIHGEKALGVCPKCNHYYIDGEICSCLGNASEIKDRKSKKKHLIKRQIFKVEAKVDYESNVPISEKEMARCLIANGLYDLKVKEIK